MGFSVDWRVPFIIRGPSSESLGEAARDDPLRTDRDLERAEVD